MSNTPHHVTDDAISRFLRARSADPELGLLDDIIRTVGATPRDRPWFGLRPVALPRRTLLMVSLALLVATMGAIAVGSRFLQPVLPRSPFEGIWVSTSDADGGTQTMTVQVSADDAVEITVRDDVATVCGATSSTMTGAGRIDGGTYVVIPAPIYTCDDGREPTALSGLPLDEQLRDWTLVLDPRAGTLSDGVGGVWMREGADAANPEPPISDTMWPQSSLEEAREAQRLADAGDPGYTWQVEPQLNLFEEMTIEEHGQVELVDRFLREVLGWEAHMFNPGSSEGPDGRTDGVLPDLRYLRCAPGRTNPLYPPGPEPEMGELCAPTLDDLRYESVSLDLAQLVRQGRDGIWVVTRWSLTPPFPQADPVAVEAQATELLEEFLAARVAGTGADGHVQVFSDGDVPLLYATTAGAPYERYEIDRVGGPGWPSGFMTFSARLFADGDATVVEQEISWAPDPGLWLDVNTTTENGQPIVVSYSSADGEVTVSAPSTWAAWLPGKGAGSGGHEQALDVWFGNIWRHEDLFGSGGRIGLVDPVAYDSWCAENGGSPLLTAPADAAAIAQQVIADPNFETTAPVAARVGGLEAVSIDVSLAPGGSPCGVGMIEISRWIHELWEPGWRLRLYLVDLPEGMSVDTLAITVVAPEESFDEVIAETAPIIDSIEFHTR
jgi:hypothetical protein